MVSRREEQADPQSFRRQRMVLLTFVSFLKVGQRPLEEPVWGWQAGHQARQEGVNFIGFTQIKTQRIDHLMDPRPLAEALEVSLEKRVIHSTAHMR